MTTKKDLLKRIAYLESVNDHLETELSDLDKLMRLVGFNQGIETVKVTAAELIENGSTERDEDNADERDLYL